MLHGLDGMIQLIAFRHKGLLIFEDRLQKAFS